MSFKYIAGTSSAMMGTELNSLATGSGVTGTTVYDNTPASNGYFWGDFELVVTFGSAPTANNTVELYLVPSEDGTNYATTTDGASPVVDLGSFIGSFNLAASTSLHRRHVRGVPLPPCKFKLYATNKAGVAFPASGSTITLYPYAEQ